jgi:hypothetical protein
MDTTIKTLSAAGMIAACGLAGSASGQVLVTLFEEDFESFPLTPNQEEQSLFGTAVCETEAFLGDGVFSGAPNVNPECMGVPSIIPTLIDPATGLMFNPSPFDGDWTYNNWDAQFNSYNPADLWGQLVNMPDGTPDGPVAADTTVNIGVAEWQGWSIADFDFWLASDDQRRSDFTKAQGSLLVADPDEWDDFDPAEPPRNPDAVTGFNSIITSPPISIAGVDAGTIFVRFDSSWRPEDGAVSRLTYSIDGGPRQVLLRWESQEFLDTNGDGVVDTVNPFFKDDTNPLTSTNETIELTIPNQADDSILVLQWENLDHRNDWWWAVDNIEVGGQAANPTQPPAAFALLAAPFYPNRTPTVNWTRALNAVDYEVIFADDAAFTSIASSAVTTALTYTPPAGDLLAGVYFVKVIARNQLGTSEQTAQTGIDTALPADLNGDGVVNGSDIDAFSTFFNM